MTRKRVITPKPRQRRNAERSTGRAPHADTRGAQRDGSNADVVLNRLFRAGTEPVAALDRLWGLSLLLGGLMQRGLAERGLTLARAAVVTLLARAGASTQRSLSLALRVTPRNITGLVDALETDNLVVRAPHPSDRRATLVTLTEKGTALAADLKRDQDGFAETLFGDDDPAKLRAFVRSLDRVLIQVEKRLGPPE